MKTLLLMDALDTGGTERQMEMLLRHWPRDQGEITVLATRGGEGQARFESEAPVLVVGRHGRNDVGFFRRFVQDVRISNPDVILAAHRFVGLLAVGLPFGRTRPPVVCCIRGRHRFTGLQSLLYDRLHPRWMRSRAALVLVNAQAVVDDLVAREPGLRNMVRLVPNGLELDRFDAPVDVEAWRRRNGIPPHAALAVSVGRLADVKMPELAIDALATATARDHDVHLAWVGDGPLRRDMEQRAFDRDVQDRVHWIGDVDDPAEPLLSADLYVHPSRWENTSNAILEAMGARVPVVARGVGGNPDLLGHGERGLLVDTDDARTFAAAWARCLDDGAETSRRVERARLHVEEVFGVEHMVRAHVDALRAAVQSGSRSPR